MWIQLAVMLVAVVLTYALRPKPEGQSPATLADVSIPTIDQGTPVTVVFGDCWIDNWMVLWYGDMGVQPIKGGGKK